MRKVSGMAIPSRKGLQSGKRLSGLAARLVVAGLLGLTLCSCSSTVVVRQLNPVRVLGQITDTPFGGMSDPSRSALREAGLKGLYRHDPEAGIRALAAWSLRPGEAKAWKGRGTENLEEMGISRDMLWSASREDLWAPNGVVEAPGEALKRLDEMAGAKTAGLAALPELALRAGLQEERRGNLMEAAGLYATAAEMALANLLQSQAPAEEWLTLPTELIQLRLYNKAAARYFDLMDEAPGIASLTDQPAMLDGPLWDYAATLRLVPPRLMGGAGDGATGTWFDKFIPAGDLKILGFRTLAKEEGFGTPLTGIRKNTEDRMLADETRFVGEEGSAMPLTGFFEYGTGSTDPVEARATIVDATKVLEWAPDGTGAIPLSANFTAPPAYQMRGNNEIIMGLKSLVISDELKDLEGLYFAAPYDPEKIPVLLIHGLDSSPMIWRDVMPVLQEDPYIRQHFQFWVFFYPSGFPLHRTAWSLRNAVRSARDYVDPDRTNPNLDKMVVIGHSMGGVLARSLTVDVKDTYWARVSEDPLEKVLEDLNPSQQIMAKEMVYFEGVPWFKRAIFISSPHRGANLATSPIGNFASRLVGLPGDFLELQQAVFAQGQGLFRTPSDSETEAASSSTPPNLARLRTRKITSISSLSPNSPFLLALDEAPRRPGVVYHCIMGNRGKDGPVEKSSDGVVQYSSSHLEGAESELLVDSGHNAFRNQQAIAEIARILRLHLEGYGLAPAP